MLKKYVFIFILLSITVFAYSEIGVDIGLETGINYEILKTEEMTENQLDIPVLGIPIFFNVFPARESKIGFGFDINSMFSVSIIDEIKYIGDDDYFPVSSDVEVKAGERYGFVNGSGYGYYPYYEKNKSILPSMKFMVTPLLLFRWNLNAKEMTSIIGFGPSYSLYFDKMCFAKIEDKVSNTEFNALHLETVDRQRIGILVRYNKTSLDIGYHALKSFGLEIGIDFIENSQFTGNLWKPCFNGYIGINIQTGWNFATAKDKLIESEKEKQKAKLAEDAKKIEEALRIKAEKETEEQEKLENERKAQEEQERQERIAREEKEKSEKQKRDKELSEKVLSAFSYNKIPFGKNMDEILKLCDGVRITEDKDCKVDFIKDYSLPLLKGGIYSLFGSVGAYLSEKCSKTYILTSDYWENTSSIVLYFTKSFEKEDYTLMMVAKFQKNPTQTTKENLYSANKKAITNTLGISPSEYSTNYINIGFGRVNAYVANWQTTGKNIYLFVDDTGVASNSSLRGPLIVYSDNLQCQKYLNSCALYEKKQKAEAESKIQIDF